VAKWIKDFEIKIKLCEQGHERDCVSACVKSILDTYYPQKTISKEEIGKMLGTSHRSGTQLHKFKNLNRLLSKRNIPFVFEIPDKCECRGLTWKKIIVPTSKGLPTICIVNRAILTDRGHGDHNPHAIIIAGKEGDNIKYYDPLIISESDKRVKTVTPQKFMNAWTDEWRMAIFIKKSGQTRLV